MDQRERGLDAVQWAELVIPSRAVVYYYDPRAVGGMPRSGPCASYWTGRGLGPDLDDHLIGQSSPLPQLNTGLCVGRCVSLDNLSGRCDWQLSASLFSILRAGGQRSAMKSMQLEGGIHRRLLTELKAHPRGWASAPSKGGMVLGLLGV